MNDKAMLNLPNILTIARIFMIPVMFMCLMMQAYWVCFAVYTIAALTDFFDGWLARKLDQITLFGTFLDPISDKIFVGCLLVMFVGFGQLSGFWMIPALIIMTREFLVSGLREFLGPHNVQLPVTKLAKWKTATQMLALGFLIVPQTLLVGQILLCIAALLTVVTGWGYVKAGWRFINRDAP